MVSCSTWLRLLLPLGVMGEGSKLPLPPLCISGRVQLCRLCVTEGKVAGEKGGENVVRGPTGIEGLFLLLLGVMETEVSEMPVFTCS